MQLFCCEVNLRNSCVKLCLGAPNKTQIFGLGPKSVTFPTAKVRIIIFYMKEALTMGFTPKSIKLSPASERSVNQISSMCAPLLSHEERGYKGKSEFHSLTALKKK